MSTFNYLRDIHGHTHIVLFFFLFFFARMSIEKATNTSSFDKSAIL